MSHNEDNIQGYTIIFKDEKHDHIHSSLVRILRQLV